MERLILLDLSSAGAAAAGRCSERRRRGHRRDESQAIAARGASADVREVWPHSSPSEQVPGVALRFSATPGRPTRAPAAIGADTRSALADWGIAAPRIESLLR